MKTIGSNPLVSCMRCYDIATTRLGAQCSTLAGSATLSLCRMHTAKRYGDERCIVDKPPFALSLSPWLVNTHSVTHAERRRTP